jgi:hypothetical protein
MRIDREMSVLAKGSIERPSAAFCLVYCVFLIGLQFSSQGLQLIDRILVFEGQPSIRVAIIRSFSSDSDENGTAEMASEESGLPLQSDAAALAQLPARTDAMVDMPRGANSDLLSGKIGVQGIKFDLGAPFGRADAGSEIDIRKKYLVNGVDAGTALMRVSADSRLSISVGEFKKIAPRLRQSRIADQLEASSDDEFIFLDVIRERGIQIRYDPTKDEIQFSG